MNRCRRWMLSLLILMIASGVVSGAVVVRAEDSVLTLYDAKIQIAPGSLTRLTLPGDTDSQAEYTFTPTANGEYDVYLFPMGDDAVSAEAELWQDDELIAEGTGSMKVLTCRLNAGSSYLLKLSGTGTVMLEIARDTLSRCFDQPIELDDGSDYSKLIARGGDVHWYCVTAESSGAAIIACAPKARELRLRAWLFDESGRRIASAEMLSSGTAVMSAEFEEGRKYYIRVAASNEGTGKYTLNLLRDANAERPDAVTLSAVLLQIDGRSAQALTAASEPEGASTLIYLDSSNPSVAIATTEGTVEGRRAGDAVVTAYAFGGARSSCRVVVNQVDVDSVTFASSSMTLSVGEDAALNVTIEPVNAIDRSLSYTIADETVATLGEDGVLTALAEGETEVIVSCGGRTDTMTLTVTAAERRYRALFIGEQNYAASVEAPRQGSVKSVENVLALFKSASFDGEEYSTSMVMDVSRDAALAAVRKTFDGATEADVSLVYITCHGYYKAGMTFFLMADGSALSAADLEKELRQIPGEIILLADCCGSGGLLGEASDPEDMLEGVTAAFSQTNGGSSVHGSKFIVIASAKLDQDSHRISFNAENQSDMATVFARALCDALGWSMDRSTISTMRADANYDGQVTLSELGSYLKRRVTWYLNRAGDYSQTVCVYPALNDVVIFQRDTE